MIDERTERRAGRAIAIASAAFIAFMTLRPSSAPSTGAIDECLVCGMFGMVDVVLNVILFIPLGAGLRLSGVRWWRAALAGVALSATVELLQYRWVAGRDASVGDLAMNSLGALIGVAIASRWRWWAFPGRRTARRLAIAGALGWIAVATFTTWALGLAVAPGRVFVQCPARLPQYAPYPGRVLSGAFDGVPCPSFWPQDGVAGRPHFSYPAISATAEVTSGGVPDRTAAIVSARTRGNHQNEVAVLAQDGSTLVFRVLLRTSYGRIRTPSVGLLGVFPPTPDTTTARIWGEADGEALYVGMERGGVTRYERVTLGPELGWVLLMFWDIHLDHRSGVLSALWMAGLLFPVAYWATGARVGRRRWPALAFTAAAGAVGLAVVPLLMGAPASGAGGWAGGAAGAILGYVVGARLLGGERRDHVTA